MQDAMIEGSTSNDSRTSDAPAWSLELTAPLALLATIWASLLALAVKSPRVELRLLAIRIPLASNSAALLISVVSATIFFGIERLRNDIIDLLDAWHIVNPRPRFFSGFAMWRHIDSVMTAS